MVETNSKPAMMKNEPLHRYERLLLDLHRLISADRGESKEADDLRDIMDGPWTALDETQRDVTDGLAADLYMISGKEIPLPSVSSETAEELDLRRARLYEDRRWIPFLQLMRSGPTTLTPWFVAFGRARAYDQLGLKLAAAHFMEYADLLHSKDNYKALAMAFYKEAGELDIAVRLARAAIENPQSQAGLLVIASSTLLASTRHQPKESAMLVYKQITTILEPVLKNETITSDVRLSGFIITGLAYEFLGDIKRAIEAFDAAQQLEPFNLVAREARAGVTIKNVTQISDNSYRNHRFDLAEQLPAA